MSRQFAYFNGSLVKANKDLPYVREGAEFLCPNLACEDWRMILKKGEKKVPHFSCVNKTFTCTSLGEKFSQAHKMMEEFIQSFLNIPDSNMEYSQLQGVRPDALYLDKYAIEMQHSNISPQEIERRNTIYQFSTNRQKPCLARQISSQSAATSEIKVGARI